MKKLSVLFLATVLSLSLIGCGGDADSSTTSSADPVDTLTAEKIVGLWTDSEIELTYEFFLDFTFNTYVSDIGGTTGEYELLEDSIKLIFTEDSFQIGRFDFYSDTFELDDSIGTFQRVTGDNSSNDNLGPFFGSWYSKSDGVSYTFNSDGSFVKNSYDGSILAGIYDTGERDIYIYGDDDSVFTGYISEDKQALEISSYNGLFTKEFFNINDFEGAEDSFDIASIFGSFKYPDDSEYYTFYSDMTFTCYYQGGSYNGNLYFDGNEISYTADNGNQGSISYFAESDEIRFNGRLTNLIRGTVVFEEDNIEDIDTTMLDSKFVGRRVEASDMGDGYIDISQDGTFEMYTADLGKISGSCYSHNYTLYLKSGDAEFTGSFDNIEGSLNISGAGRFYD